MERVVVKPRHNWKAECDAVGFNFCDMPSNDGLPYWTEGVAYQFSEAEIDLLDDATVELHSMCMELVGDVIKSGDYPTEYQLTDTAKLLAEQSWGQGKHHLYGRFDFAFTDGIIKLLEYNGDTPTGLLEASVVQWNWLEELKLPDQFNSIHEKLINRWSMVAGDLPFGTSLHFLSSEDAGREDWGTLEYLMETAFQAGFQLSELAMGSVGWDEKSSSFVDLNDQSIRCAFKLYPWEWLLAEDFSSHIPKVAMRWVEPPWKILLSSKALLPLLWQKYPNHPYLLEAHFQQDGVLPRTGGWVRKPLYSREGANVTKVEAGAEQQLSGSLFMPEYDTKGYVLQQWVDLPVFDSYRPILGSWVIGDEAAGIGIREEKDNLVTGNCSHFVPHYFVD